MKTTHRLVWIMAIVVGIALVMALSAGHESGESARSAIVQGDDLESARRAALDVGGAITHELGIIDAVAADLTPGQLQALLDRHPGMTVHDNATATSAARGGRTANRTTDANDPYESTNPGQGTTPYSAAPMLVSADDLHDTGVTGLGATIAVLDTGTNMHMALANSATWQYRVLAHYDAILDEEPRRIGSFQGSDGSGHGSHVSALALSSAIDSVTGKYNGVAPDAQFVAVRAFDDSGCGTYADVIRGLDWIVANKDVHGIRVLNLSFSAPVQSHYWEDPVNQAVMRAWQAGIVVVVSAGNGGPNPMTIGVPGNVPYVITVGAMTDNHTLYDPTDDNLARFSATGPTAESFVKPDLVAPGGHLKAPMERNDTIAIEHPEFHDVADYFMMSGTSQAAGVVSGVVALMLQVDPALSPDDIKCRLIASAHPALLADGTMAYSPFRQGAGMVHALDATYSPVLDCANRGMDIAADLAGSEHYAGAARLNEQGEYYIEGIENSSVLWSESSLWHESIMWSESTLWHETALWGESVLWSESFLWGESFLWSESVLWNESFLWGEADLSSSAIGINTWVDQVESEPPTPSEPIRPTRTRFLDRQDSTLLNFTPRF